jgi:hypothetical protein
VCSLKYRTMDKVQKPRNSMNLVEMLRFTQITYVVAAYVIYVFIYDLFNNTVRISDCIASTGSMIAE